MSRSTHPAHREPDVSLRRVERDAAIVCIVMAVLALLLQRGGVSGALGVIGGGAVMAYSFRAIRAGVDTLVRRVAPSSAGAPPVSDAPPPVPAAQPAEAVGADAHPASVAADVTTAPATVPQRQPGVALAVTRFVLRYVVIGLVAWLLLAKLGAHPVGMMAGVTAPVLALGLEAIRLQRR